MEELLRSINYYTATNFASAIRNRVFTGERGRPRLHIQFEQLQFVLEKNPKVAEIANLFGTSKRTIKRRMNDFGLPARDLYFTLTDQELDELITRVSTMYLHLAGMTGGGNFTKEETKEETKAC